MKTLEQTLEEKLQASVDSQCKYADLNGSTTLSTCGARNWDADIWAHKGVIVSAIKARGYGVSISVNFGVTDILVTKQITLK